MSQRKATLIAVLVAAPIFAAPHFATHLKPEIETKEVASRVEELKTALAIDVSGWAQDNTQQAYIVSPDLERVLDLIYTTTVNRTFTDGTGNRVMLSVAYGAEQTRALRVHKPETCYAAQGFKVSEAQRREIVTNEGKKFPVILFKAEQPGRNEHVLYWIRTGDRVIAGWLDQNIATITDGLSGRVPDGLLYRISIIDKDKKRAESTLMNFAKQFIEDSDGKGRSLLIGKF